MGFQEEPDNFLTKIGNNSEKKHFFLSSNDEYVPPTHIGIYALTSDYRNKGVYMGINARQKIRENTFHSVYELFRQCDAPSFSQFFNYNLEELCALGLVHFENNQALAPIVNLIECFEKYIKKDSKSIIISFGINRNDLREYLTLRKNDAEIPERLKRSKYYLNAPAHCDKLKTRFGGYFIKSSSEGGFSICDNAIMRRYKDWCALNGLTLEDGILMAMEVVVNEYSDKKLEELEKYDKTTPFDYLLLKQPQKQSEQVSVTVTLNGYIFSMAKAIIERINRDPKNLLHPVDFQLYVNNALFLLNKKAPLKYRDPKLFLEYGDYDKMEKEAFVIARKEQKEG